MARYSLRGLTLSVPEPLGAAALEAALSSGRYEHQEANAILEHLRPDDRFLDLGAGLGYLCALAARVVGAGSVTGVEASGELADIAAQNLAANGFADVTLVHGAVTGTEQGEVELVVRQAFWANALKSTRQWPAGVRVERVPARPIAGLLALARPTVVCADIEGGEIEVLTQPLGGVRLIVVEFHPGVYGDAGVDRISAALDAQGFEPDIRGSRGATVVFRRDLAGG